MALGADELGRVQQAVLQVELDTQQVRGLDPKIDVPEHFVSKSQMRSNILAQRDQIYTREDARVNELELWLLRLVGKPSIGLYQMQADWLSERLLGYYDFNQKELFVLNNQAQLDPQTRQTLSHEYVHSLQDQYYDLQKLLPAKTHNNDHDLAVRSVVEGDASLSSLLYADQFMSHDDFQKLPGLPGSAALERAPDIVRDNLYFPYTKGVEFIKTLYALGGFGAVNNALTNPPSSTEQILHPKKFLQAPRDEPLPVGLPPLTSTLGAGWVFKDTQKIGEFELGVLLSTNGVPTPDAEADVTGWGGGQYDLYQSGANSLVMMMTRWDTADAAAHFYDALTQSLNGATPYANMWVDGGRYITIQRLIDRVVLVSSTDPNAARRAPMSIR